MRALRLHVFGASAALSILANSTVAEERALSYVDATGAVASLAMEGGATEVEHGDVNGDGHPDLVLVGDHGSPYINTPQHGTTVWLGDGQGGWTLRQTGDFGYGGIALGDVDNDGLTDVGYGVHHNYSSTDLGDQILEVALGDGTGYGWTAWDDGLATNGEDWGMFGTDFGDIDGDGDLDVGSISFGCCAGVHIYRNQGDGTWQQSFGFLGGNSAMEFQFADVNGDGHLDAVVAQQLGLVYVGDGTGAFTPANGNLPANAGYPGTGAGDVDGDGRDEVSLVRSSAPEVWRWGTGNQWTEISGDLPVGGSWESTELVDMDLDGRADLVAFGQGTLAIWSWTPGDVWLQRYSGQTPGPGDRDHHALRAGVDLDHNGYPDISIVQDESTVWYSSFNTHRVLFEASSPTELSVHCLQPGAGRVWIGGQVRFVDWTCAVPGTDVGTVAIDLSTGGPTGPWSPLASGLPNAGRYQLTTPLGVDSDTCHVRLVVDTASGRAATISEEFTIEGELGVRYCTSSPNSTGGAAVIEAAGSTHLGHEHLELTAAPVPAGQFGFFFFGPTPQQLPLGNGTLCIGAPQTRLLVEATSAGQVLDHVVDVVTGPASMFQPGDVLHFQASFRDPAAGGAGFDFSDGLTLGFIP